jgi:hypothetical protein
MPLQPAKQQHAQVLEFSQATPQTSSFFSASFCVARGDLLECLGSRVVLMRAVGRGVACVRERSIAPYIYASAPHMQERVLSAVLYRRRTWTNTYWPRRRKFIGRQQPKSTEVSVSGRKFAMLYIPERISRGVLPWGLSMD